jgi:(4S)-4-hydroxy-5-phosphonooxypentane-2,3-dione isomerase
MGNPGGSRHAPIDVRPGRATALLTTHATLCCNKRLEECRMIVRVISLKVKREHVAEFKAACMANHTGSLKEPGIQRFDVLQNESSPEEFMLYEVYETQEATLTHKETVHYKKWIQTVEAMFAEPRKSSVYTVVAPAPDYE